MEGLLIRLEVLGQGALADLQGALEGLGSPVLGGLEALELLLEQPDPPPCPAISRRAASRHVTSQVKSASMAKTRTTPTASRTCNISDPSLLNGWIIETGPGLVKANSKVR